MERAYNFGAGPAMLPTEVMLEAQAEMLNWHGTGMSIMEIGHRTSDFKKVAEQSEADLRELMSIPNNYKVLFLGGGASTQFAMVPLNLFGSNASADYVDTGVWSKKAIAEGRRYGEVNVCAQSENKDGLLYIPPQTSWQLGKNPAYLHYTPNETIDGVEFSWLPKVSCPLVADMTSMILSRPINVSDFGIIYAGAQKNISHAGMTVVIIHEDLLLEPLPKTPTLYIYKIQAEHNSLYNTPPTFCWYMAGLVFSWMKAKGGVQAFYEMNQRKAKKLYTLIDQLPEFYDCRVHASCRSMMNVMFYLRDEQLTPKFLSEAAELGLLNLRGHRVSGGVRASIYNSMPEKAVDILADFMLAFARRNG